MSELVNQLGIDLKLLIAQGVNFLILLFVLTKFVYRPLMKLVEERRQKIELGIKGGEKATQLIKEAEKTGQVIIKEADVQALSILSEAEKNAQLKAQEIALNADKKSQQALKEAMLLAERREKEEMEKVSIEAKRFVREAIIKTVELKPDQIDEKLIEEALRAVKIK